MLARPSPEGGTEGRERGVEVPPSMLASHLVGFRRSETTRRFAGGLSVELAHGRVRADRR
jgi:hypothetical protein